MASIIVAFHTFCDDLLIKGCAWVDTLVVVAQLE